MVQLSDRAFLTVFREREFEEIPTVLVQTVRAAMTKSEAGRGCLLVKSTR
jgi:hypothetical protein